MQHLCLRRCCDVFPHTSFIARVMRAIDWTLWGILLIAAILELVGDLAFKWWAETDHWPGFVSGLILYILALFLFAHLLRRAELAVSLLCGGESPLCC